MRRRHCRPSLAQGSQLFAGQRAARMQSNFPPPRDLVAQRARGPCDLRIRHAQPNHSGAQGSRLSEVSQSNRATANLLRQPPRFPERRGIRSRHHRLDRIPSPPQRHCQRACHVSGSNQRDARLLGHAGEHSRRVWSLRSRRGLCPLRDAGFWIARPLGSQRPQRKPQRSRRRSSWVCPTLSSVTVHFRVPCLLYILSMPKSSSGSRPNKKFPAHILSSRVVYRGPVFSVTTDEVEEPGGVRARRDVIRHSGSVVVLAVDSTRTPRVLLERQYRHAANDYLWELPAGRIDPGEQELNAAKRELIEETGYRADRWRRILKFYASPGFVAETMAVYMATGLKLGEAEPEDDEMIYKRMLALPTVVKMVMKGTIRDAKTIASVLWLHHVLNHRRGKL